MSKGREKYFRAISMNMLTCKLGIPCWILDVESASDNQRMEIAPPEVRINKHDPFAFPCQHGTKHQCDDTLAYTSLAAGH